MCGIAGLIGRDADSVRAALARMSGAQCHRGPDDAGEQVCRTPGLAVGLAHRRLSILDLSPAGHQPMADPATGAWVIFNGEIYNFAPLRAELEAAGQPFRGHSDTEVLLYGLARHGPGYVRRLQGMFAFAFFDPRGRTLLLARDSVGIKPLYVADTPGGGLAFASEVRGVLASGLVSREPDPRGVAGLLAYGAPQQPLTLFISVASFPAGSYQQVKLNDDGTLTKHPPVRYWAFPRTDSSITEADVVPRIRRTLDDAVRDHLVADVPVGLFLSSGLDSTILAALAAKHTPHLRSFTVAFADQPDLSEGPLAAQTAKLFGLDHTEIQLTGADALAAATDWLAALDQPCLDGLNVFVISKAVRAHGITVALSGQGGDELFGGYPSFRDAPRLARAMRAVRWLPREVRAAGARLATVGRSAAVRQKLVDIARTDGRIIDLCLQRRRAMSDGQLAGLGLRAAGLGLLPSFLPAEALAGVNLDEPDAVAVVSQAESWFYQGNTLLHISDTNGMAHSLEIRVPVLDQRVLDLAYPIPGRVRLPRGVADKHLLRAAFAGHLRPELLAQKKRGFTLPVRRWMVGRMRELCESAIASLKSTSVLEPAGVDQIWRTFLADPESPIWSRALTLVALGTYLRNVR